MGIMALSNDLKQQYPRDISGLFCEIRSDQVIRA